MKPIWSLPLVAFLFFAGCISTRYVAPETSAIPSEYYSRVIDKPFDQTWSALMQYAGSAYFDIQQFEKQSGLLVFSFGTPIPSEYISGGHFKVTGNMQFDGDFVDFCVKHHGGYLEDRMNVIVTPVDSGRTRVVARVHYVFTCSVSETGMDSWSFESGTSDTHDAERVITELSQRKTRTLMPTYKAERALLDAVESSR
jgi:hypothetical protein